MAAITPMGTLINAPIPTIITVPKMALPKPPPSTIGGGGNSVNTESDRELIPLVSK